MQNELYYTVADEDEFNDIITGEAPRYLTAWNSISRSNRLPSGKVGVLWKALDDTKSSARPLAIVVNDSDQRRLFGRVTQLRSEVSPLSCWCHVLDPDLFNSMDDAARVCDLGGLEAAWAGLVIAEAILLAERHSSQLKVAACLATSSYAVARTKSLWNSMRVSNICEKYDLARGILGMGEVQRGRHREILQPIWSTLENVAEASPGYSPRELLPLSLSLRALRSARFQNYPDEAYEFFQPLLIVAPELEKLVEISSVSPEGRVREFDRVVSLLDEKSRNTSDISRHVYAMAAAYIATVAAGGSPSLGLVEGIALKRPEVLAWAYVVGGIGERIVWTSSFDGLGRLVARELMRPLHLDEPPSCDFSLDEAVVVIDPKLSDPLVRLQIKQSRTVSVSLFSGVNVVFPFGDNQQMENRSQVKDINQRLPIYPPSGNIDPMTAFAEAIWPYIRTKMENNDLGEDDSGHSPKKRGKTKKFSSYQPRLPLKKP